MRCIATVVFPDPATPCTIRFILGDLRITVFCSFWIVEIISPSTALLFLARYFVSSSSFATTSESKKSISRSSAIS